MLEPVADSQEMDSGPGRCWVCEGTGRLWCSSCRFALYCSLACQKKDRLRHLDECVNSSRRRVCCSYCGREEALGGVPCSDCLVAAYCTDSCRQIDAKNHRSVCLQAKQKVVEAAKKINEWNRRAKGIPQYLGRLIHGVDYLRWSENEGVRLQSVASPSTHQQQKEETKGERKESGQEGKSKRIEDNLGEETLRLLLLGADLKHVLCTLHDTPDSCTQPLEITLVDPSPHILARDLLILYLLMLPDAPTPLQDTARIHAHAEKVVMVFYSLFLDMETHALLCNTLHNLLNLTHKSFLHETRQQIQIDPASYSLVQLVWNGWMSFANDPTALHKLEKVRSLKLSGKVIKDVLSRYVKSCPREHQKAVSDWIKKGSMKKNRGGNFPNVTLACFSPLKREHLEKFEDVNPKWSEETEWIKAVSPEDDMVYAPHGIDMIFQDWDFLTVSRNTKKETNVVDMYRLYLTQVFVRASHKLLQSNQVSLNFIRSNVRELAAEPQKLRGRFDRIASGIHADLLGTPYVLQHFGCLLKADNVYARLLTHHRVWSLCLDWRSDQQARETCHKSLKCNRAPDPLLMLTGRWATFRHFLQAELLHHLHVLDGRPLEPDNVLVFRNVSHAYDMVMSDYTRQLNHIVPFRFQADKRTVSMVDSRLHTLEWRRLARSRRASAPAATNPAPKSLPSTPCHGIDPASRYVDNLISLSKHPPTSAVDSRPVNHLSSREGSLSPCPIEHTATGEDRPSRPRSSSRARPRSLYVSTRCKSPLLSPEFDFWEHHDLIKEKQKTPTALACNEIPEGISRRIQQALQADPKPEKVAPKSAPVSPELTRKMQAVKEKASVFERGTAARSTFPETRKNVETVTPSTPVKKLVSMFSRAFSPKEKEVEVGRKFKRSNSLHESRLSAEEKEEISKHFTNSLKINRNDKNKVVMRNSEASSTQDSGMSTFPRRARPHSVAVTRFSYLEGCMDRERQASPAPSKPPDKKYEKKKTLAVDTTDNPRNKRGHISPIKSLFSGLNTLGVSPIMPQAAAAQQKIPLRDTITVKRDEVRLVNLRPGSPRLPSPMSPTPSSDNIEAIDWPETPVPRQGSVAFDATDTCGQKKSPPDSSKDKKGPLVRKSPSPPWKTKKVPVVRKSPSPPRKDKKGLHFKKSPLSPWKDTKGQPLRKSPSPPWKDMKGQPLRKSPSPPPPKDGKVPLERKSPTPSPPWKERKEQHGRKSPSPPWKDRKEQHVRKSPSPPWKDRKGQHGRKSPSPQPWKFGIKKSPKKIPHEPEYVAPHLTVCKSPIVTLRSPTPDIPQPKVEAEAAQPDATPEADTLRSEESRVVTETATSETLNEKERISLEGIFSPKSSPTSSVANLPEALNEQSQFEGKYNQAKQEDDSLSEPVRDHSSTSNFDSTTCRFVPGDDVRGTDFAIAIGEADLNGQKIYSPENFMSLTSMSVSSSLTDTDMEVSELFSQEEQFCPIKDPNHCFDDQGKEFSRHQDKKKDNYQTECTQDETNTAEDKMDSKSERTENTVEGQMNILRMEKKELRVKSPVDIINIRRGNLKKSVAMERMETEPAKRSPVPQIIENSPSVCKMVEHFAQCIQAQQEVLEYPTSPKKDPKRSFWNQTSEDSRSSPRHVTKTSEPNTTQDWKGNNTDRSIHITHINTYEVRDFDAIGEAKSSEPTSPEPTFEPTLKFISKPKVDLAPEPTRQHDAAPEPTRQPDLAPEPTRQPDLAPEPTRQPDLAPEPTRQPDLAPEPIRQPDLAPEPTRQPDLATEPTRQPDLAPEPTRRSTRQPDLAPEPTRQPYLAPEPTRQPDLAPEPTRQPDLAPEPTRQPNLAPEPTRQPDLAPEPTRQPDLAPEPTRQTDLAPEPTRQPDLAPEPTRRSTRQPDLAPEPTRQPDLAPEPTRRSTRQPDLAPEPTRLPDLAPEPTRQPNLAPEPTRQPDLAPEPTRRSTRQPTHEHIPHISLSPPEEERGDEEIKIKIDLETYVRRQLLTPQQSSSSRSTPVEGLSSGPVNKMVEQFSQRIKAQSLPTSPRSSRPNSIGTLVQQDFLRLYTATPTDDPRTEDDTPEGTPPASDDWFEETMFEISDDEEDISPDFGGDGNKKLSPEPDTSASEDEMEVIVEMGNKISIQSKRKSKGIREFACDEQRHEFLQKVRHVDDGQMSPQTKRYEESRSPSHPKKKDVRKGEKTFADEVATAKYLGSDPLLDDMTVVTYTVQVDTLKLKDECTSSGLPSTEGPATASPEKERYGTDTAPHPLYFTDDQNVYTPEELSFTPPEHSLQRSALKRECRRGSIGSSPDSSLQRKSVKKRVSEPDASSHRTPPPVPSRTGRLDRISFRNYVKTSIAHEDMASEQSTGCTVDHDTRVVEYTSSFEVSTDEFRANPESVEEAVEAISFLSSGEHSSERQTRRFTLHSDEGEATDEDDGQGARRRTTHAKQRCSVRRKRLASVHSPSDLQDEDEGSLCHAGPVRDVSGCAAGGREHCDVPSSCHREVVTGCAQAKQTSHLHMKHIDEARQCRHSDEKERRCGTPEPLAEANKDSRRFSWGSLKRRKRQDNVKTKKEEAKGAEAEQEDPASRTQHSKGAAYNFFFDKKKMKLENEVSNVIPCNTIGDPTASKKMSESPSKADTIPTIISMLPKQRENGSPNVDSRLNIESPTHKTKMSPPEIKPKPRKKIPFYRDSSSSESFSQSLLRLLAPSMEESSPREKLVPITDEGSPGGREPSQSEDPCAGNSSLESLLMPGDDSKDSRALDDCQDASCESMSPLDETEVFANDTSSLSEDIMNHADGAEVRPRAGVLKTGRDRSRESRRSLRVSWGDLPERIDSPSHWSDADDHTHENNDDEHDPTHTNDPEEPEDKGYKVTQL